MTQPHLTCRELVALVTDYLELGLAPEERARVEGHLAACEDCRAHLDQVRRAIRATGALRAGAPEGEPRAALLALYRGWLAGAGGAAYDQP